MIAHLVHTFALIRANASARPPVTAILTDPLPSTCLLESPGLLFHDAVCECLAMSYLALPGQTRMCAAPRRRILLSDDMEDGCGGLRGACQSTLGQHCMQAHHLQPSISVRVVLSTLQCMKHKSACPKQGSKWCYISVFPTIAENGFASSHGSSDQRSLG